MGRLRATPQPLRRPQRRRDTGDTPRITISRLLSDPNLLAPFYSGPSWDRWRACLKAAYAEPLTSRELALFKEVAGDRDPPAKPVREFVAVVGRNGGKDSAVAALATAAALRDYAGSLRPGEMASIVCLACDRDQAAILLRYIRGYFVEVPLLREMVLRETANGLVLVNRVEVVVVTNSYRAPRGRTIPFACLDEAAFYPREGSARPDEEVFAALTPALLRLPGSMIAVISSPHMKSGLLYNKWKKHFGKNDDRVLVVHGASTIFNATLSQAAIDEEMEADPQRAAAEYLAEWRGDLASAFDLELIESAVDRGVAARPPVPGQHYAGYVDASSGRGDSFTCSIGHAEGQKIVQDAFCEWRSPFNAQQVLREAAAFAKTYRLRELWGDQYAVGFITAGFQDCGIAYKERIKVNGRSLDRSDVYLSALPIFTSGRVTLLDHKRTIAQFAALERRAYPTGADKVNHPINGADDCCNAVAGMIVLLSTGKPPWRVSDRALEIVSGHGGALPVSFRKNDGLW
jgi:hypothetical protein